MTTKYMCLFWKCIFRLFLTTQVVTLIAVQAEISFNCDNTGFITSISHDSANEDQILIQTGDTYCHYSIESCKTQNKKNTLHVVIQAEEKLKIMGGNPTNLKHYLLACKDEHDVTAIAHAFSPRPITTLTPMTTKIMGFNSPGALTLKIKRGNKELTDGVYIGEQLTLEMGSLTGYKVYPKDCVATNGVDDTDDVGIWTDTSSSPSSSTCSTYDHAITTEKWKYHTSTQTTTISIYAFRFISSKEVTIRCNAHLCPTLHDDCSSSCMEDVTRRRRRDSPLLRKEQPIKRTEAAQVSFRVKSESIDQNKANALSARLTVIITAVILGERFMRFI